MDGGYAAYVELREGLNETRAMGDFFSVCLLVVEMGHGMGARVRRVFEGGFGDGGVLLGWRFVEIVTDFKGLFFVESEYII